MTTNFIVVAKNEVVAENLDKAQANTVAREYAIANKVSTTITTRQALQDKLEGMARAAERRALGNAVTTKAKAAGSKAKDRVLTSALSSEELVARTVENIKFLNQSGGYSKLDVLVKANAWLEGHITGLTLKQMASLADFAARERSLQAQARVAEKAAQTERNVLAFDGEELPF